MSNYPGIEPPPTPSALRESARAFLAGTWVNDQPVTVARAATALRHDLHEPMVPATVKRLVALLQDFDTRLMPEAAVEERNEIARTVVALDAVEKVNKAAVAIEKVKKAALPPVAETRYRMLGAGEVVQEGDEFRLSGEMWDSCTSLIGLTVIPGTCCTYRRQVATEVVGQ